MEGGNPAGLMLHFVFWHRPCRCRVRLHGHRVPCIWLIRVCGLEEYGRNCLIRITYGGVVVELSVFVVCLLRIDMAAPYTRTRQFRLVLQFVAERGVRTLLHWPKFIDLKIPETMLASPLDLIRLSPHLSSSLC